MQEQAQEHEHGRWDDVLEQATNIHKSEAIKESESERSSTSRHLEDSSQDLGSYSQIAQLLYLDSQISQLDSGSDLFVATVHRQPVYYKADQTVSHSLNQILKPMVSSLACQLKSTGGGVTTGGVLVGQLRMAAAAEKGWARAAGEDRKKGLEGLAMVGLTAPHLGLMALVQNMM